MRGFTSAPHLLGSGALLFIAVTLFGVTYPVVDGWHDQWRDYANRTELAGHCSDPAHVDNPECQPDDERFDIEPWMIVPWLLTAGCLIGCLAVASPIVRRRTDA